MKFEHKYYIFYSTMWFHFLAPIVTIFFLDKGLSLTEVIFSTATVAYITTALFEIPTGAYSDMIGRIKSLVVTSILSIIVLLIFIFSNSLVGISIGGFIWGLSFTFSSGTAASLLFDTLKEEKREKEYKKIRGKSLSIAFFLLAITSIIGSFLYTIDRNFPFIASLIFTIVSFFAILSMKEPKFKRNKNFRNHLKLSFGKIFTSKMIIWACFYNMITLGIIWLFNRNYTQILLKNTGLKIAYFGLMFAYFRICSSLGSKLSHKIEDIIKEKILFVLPLIVGIIFLLMDFNNNIIIFLTGFIYFTLGAIRPGIEDYVHNKIESKERATILSIINIFTTFFQGVFILFLAFIIEKKSFYFMTTGLGVFVIISTIILWITYNNNHK